jgi:hypothetical protein
MRQIGRGLWLVVVPVLVSLACNLALGGTPTQPSGAATAGPGVAATVGAATSAATEAEGQPTAFAEELFGPGPFNLVDPTVGLAGLDGYAATLTMSFEGTRAGAAVKWSKKYVMLRAGASGAAVDDRTAGRRVRHVAGAAGGGGRRGI